MIKEKFFSVNILKEITKSIDIVKFIGNYIILNKQGRNYVGICPFHNEKNASFTINPIKKFYYCFGCKTKGTVITFLMKYSKISFVNSVNILIKILNDGIYSYRINKSESFIIREYDRILKKKISSDDLKELYFLLNNVKNFYVRKLRLKFCAIKYLKDRGFNILSVKKFCIGYAPSYWRNINFILKKYKKEIIYKSGLIIINDNNLSSNYYDFFRKRIMFPIKNISGNIVGFGGRIIDKDNCKNNNNPKYINSPETCIFKKTHELYGLFEAQFEIKKNRYVLVVEGYFDVIMLVQYGFKNTIATLGTVCSKFHLKKILNITKNVVFSFDGDLAGYNGFYGIIKLYLSSIVESCKIHFLILPRNYDPDTYIRKFGKKKFYKRIKNSIPILKFLYNEFIKKYKYKKDINYILNIILRFINICISDKTKIRIISMCSKKLNISVEKILDFCGIKSEFNSGIFVNKILSIEKKALKIFIFNPSILFMLNKDEVKFMMNKTDNSKLFKEVFRNINNFKDIISVEFLIDILKNQTDFFEFFKQISYKNIKYLKFFDQSINKNSYKFDENKKKILKKLKMMIIKIKYIIYNRKNI